MGAGIDLILGRVERLKQTGANRWLACCPAHDDSSPSLSISCVDDGRILVHCHAGCDTEAVLGAIGLDFSALFEKPLGHHFEPIRRGGFRPAELLASISHEVFVAWLILHAAGEGVLTDIAQARLNRAIARIGTAQTLADAR